MALIQLETSRFGTIEVDEKNTLHFVSPILGFEHVKRYTLLDHAENSPFKWLQAMEEPHLAFVVTNPKFFGIPYEFELPDEAAEKLGIQQAEDALVLTIVNIPNDNPALMTANLLAPLVINQHNLQGMQVVLQDASLSTRTRLLPDTAVTEKSTQTASSSSETSRG